MTSRHNSPGARARRAAAFVGRAGSLAAGLALAAAAAASATPPPLFKPGAPGEPSRKLTAEESIDLGQSRYTDADVAFMQHMIVHHSQAVEMNDLIAARTDYEPLILVGRRIAISQRDEIAMMRTWLTRRGESTEMVMDHGDMDHAAMNHAGHDMAEPSDVPLMTGMLSPKQMAELAAAEGDAFVYLWLTGMIHHHQGAIDMVDALLEKPGAGEDPEISSFLSAIVADQSAEILRMRLMLNDLSS
jgi:uncharacterized protein (DUF305 family)